MIFLGYTALGSKQSAYQTPVTLNDINKIELSNGIYDDLFITSNVSQSFTAPLDTTWDFNTTLHAGFNGDLLAGNTGYLLSQLVSIRIKYREVGSNKWTTLMNVPISSAEDLSFIRNFKFGKANTEYQIALVPVIPGNIEGNYSINNVVSNFNGLFIMEKDITYYSELDTSVTPTRNRTSSVLNPLDSKYPVIIHNTRNNYNTVAVTGKFIQKVNGEYDLNGAIDYRNSFKDFLYDGIPKFLKYYDKQTYILDTNDVIPDDTSAGPGAADNGDVKTSFNCVEIGDVSDPKDLYDCGFIDVDPSTV